MSEENRTGKKDSPSAVEDCADVKSKYKGLKRILTNQNFLQLSTKFRPTIK
jgi:hypothetical protein